MSAGLRTVPRAPGRIPLLGHAWSLWREPYGFVKSLRKAGDLVRIDLGTLPVYFVNDAALAHEVMVTKARSFEKGRFFDRLRSLVGNGLVTADSVTHRRHRRLVQPMFHRARIAGYARIMTEQAQRMTEDWQPGRTVAVDEAVADFVISTLARTMFSGELGRPAEEAVRRNVPVIIETLLLRSASPKLLDRVPIRPNRRFDAAQHELHEVIDGVIAAAREEGDTDQPDLLSTLLAARDADTGEALTDIEIRDELGTILFAGAETAVSTLAWAFYEIARRPEVEEAVLAEIDTVIGDRPVTFEDVPKLEYIRRVIDEVVRLHSVTLLMRRSTEYVELGGVTLPPSTEVAFSLYALHQDPRWFPEPQRFDPDRWLPERSGDIPREAFVPFGSGARKCIGDAFAWTEVPILIATVLAHWKLRPAPGEPPREAISAMPHPDRMPMVVERRRTGPPADGPQRPFV